MNHIDLPESARLADGIASVLAQQERAASARTLLEACALLRVLGVREPSMREAADALERNAPRVLARSVR